jgi:hypothetical protein
MSSLYVFIPGFGAPHLQIKRQILRYNVARILAHPWSKVDFGICVYDDSDVDGILPHGTTVIRHPGVVGEFIKQHANPEMMQDYDYVLMLLDDVLLQPDVDFEKMIQYKRRLRLDILSPCLTLDSTYVHDYIVHDPTSDHDIKISTYCAFLCFFMDVTSYATFYGYIDEVENPWMWGLDLMIHHVMGLHVGILNHMSVKHFFMLTCYANHPDKDPFAGMDKTFRKYGIKSMDEINYKLPCEYFRIRDTIRTIL